MKAITKRELIEALETIPSDDAPILLWDGESMRLCPLTTVEIAHVYAGDMVAIPGQAMFTQLSGISRFMGTTAVLDSRPDEEDED